MVIILNYLAPLSFIIAVVIALRHYQRGTLTRKMVALLVVVTLLLNIVITAVTPSYMPKGTSAAMPNPVFETSDAVIQDRSHQTVMTPEAQKENLENKLDAVRQATGK